MSEVRTRERRALGVAGMERELSRMFGGQVDLIERSAIETSRTSPRSDTPNRRDRRGRRLTRHMDCGSGLVTWDWV